MWQKSGVLPRRRLTIGFNWTYYRTITNVHLLMYFSPPSNEIRPIRVQGSHEKFCAILSTNQMSGWWCHLSIHFHPITGHGDGLTAGNHLHYLNQCAVSNHTLHHKKNSLQIMTTLKLSNFYGWWLVLEIILGDGQSTEASYVTDIDCFSVMQMI